MTQAQIHQQPVLAGGKTGHYLGTETSLNFGNVAEELRALRSGCAVFELKWRALITASGKDRVRWLHNMVTNTVRDLEPHRGAYNFVLNAQGRILGDLYVFNRGESLLVETDRSQVEALLATLRRFIIMDKVELADLGSSVTAIGVAGPNAEQVLSKAGINSADLQPLQISETTIDGISVQLMSGPEQKPNWFEIWVDPAHAAAIARRLSDAGASPVGAEALEQWRVLHGIPQYGKDIRERDLPQETGQTQALNFNKGCYIGQEIVERIRSRGQVHRKFTGLEFRNGVPEPGKFEADGRTFAEVTSTAHVPAASRARDLGLGYVRVDALPESGILNLSGIEAKVVDLPFQIQELY